MRVFDLSKYTFFFIVVPSIFLAFYPGRIVAITIICCYPIMIGLLLKTGNFFHLRLQGNLVIKLFFLSNVIILVRGIIDARSYGDWTTLLQVTAPLALFFPLTIYWGVSLKIAYNFLRLFIRYVVWIASVLYIQNTTTAGYTFAHALAPVYLFLLFSPYLNLKYRLLVFALAIISLISDLQLRANMLNIIVAFLISLTFYQRRLITPRLLKITQVVLFASPFIFLFLGILGIFNIFSAGATLENFQITNTKGTQEVFIDSRTPIYTDVLSEIQQKDAYIFGLGGAGKTKTSLTDLSYASFDKVYSEGRRGTESGMLNFIQWGGIFACLTYSLLLYYAASLSFKAKNWFCRMLGLWISYKFLFSFIDDPLLYNNNTLLIMISLGLCFNRKLRNATDLELKILFNRVFSANRKSKFKYSYKRL